MTPGLNHIRPDPGSCSPLASAPISPLPSSLPCLSGKLTPTLEQTAWTTTWVSSPESSSLRFCFLLSNAGTAILSTTKIMSLLKCQVGTCHRIKVQG